MAKKKPAATTDRGLLYVGTGGAHFTGIPARTLTPAECAALNEDIFLALVTSELYKLPTVTEFKALVTETATLEQPASAGEDGQDE